MNVTEAGAVNTLLRWVLQLPDGTTRVPSEDDARRAALVLAGRANRTLHAGITPDAVAAAWDPRPAITCPRCERTSWHPDDIRYGYCGACHDYTSPPQHDRDRSTAQPATRWGVQR